MERVCQRNQGGAGPPELFGRELCQRLLDRAFDRPGGLAVNAPPPPGQAKQDSAAVPGVARVRWIRPRRSRR